MLGACRLARTHRYTRSMSYSATRVIWKPVRDTPVERTLDDSSERSELGACLVIHVDQMPARTSGPARLSTAFRGWWSRLKASEPPPWEEHRGVVDHRTAERIAAEFGVSLEI